MQEVGRYRIIGPHHDSDHDPRLLLLDTNVLIEIEHLYFGSRKPHPDLRLLLERFPNAQHSLRTLSKEPVDLNYGWAAIEAAWRRGRGPDPVAWRRAVHAVSIVVQWDAAGIERAFTARRPPSSRDRTWPPALPAASAIPDPRPVIVPIYGSLMRLLSILQEGARLRSKGPLWAVRQYVDWCRHEFGIQASYPLSLAIALLAGDADEKNKIRAVFKLSGSENAERTRREVLERGLGHRLHFAQRGLQLRPAADREPTTRCTRDGRQRPAAASPHDRAAIPHPAPAVPDAHDAHLVLACQQRRRGRTQRAPRDGSARGARAFATRPKHDRATGSTSTARTRAAAGRDRHHLARWLDARLTTIVWPAPDAAFTSSAAGLAPTPPSTGEILWSSCAGVAGIDGRGALR